jgi:hypothetical protein
VNYHGAGTGALLNDGTGRVDVLLDDYGTGFNRRLDRAGDDALDYSRDSGFPVAVTGEDGSGGSEGSEGDKTK